MPSRHTDPNPQPSPDRRSSPVRPRFWLETALGGLSGLLFLLTLLWPQWMETLLGLDPDAGSGTVEWLVVALAAAVTAACALGARFEWRRERPAPLLRPDERIGGPS
ncbi:ABC transporter permease [Kitasatospora brasiliensis]|uniref:ABC transporter permease n=1 Tax=Kitasatospora brasiliensis TaxID=3058040 RepID=UPI00292DA8BC|nr:ABC transporter permease [Kitasatospora sp. K002]